MVTLARGITAPLGSATPTSMLPDEELPCAGSALRPPAPHAKHANSTILSLRKILFSFFPERLELCYEKFRKEVARGSNSEPARCREYDRARPSTAAIPARPAALPWPRPSERTSVDRNDKIHSNGRNDRRDRASRTPA